MIKKFFPLIYCLTPLCAFTDTIIEPGTPGVINDISGNLIPGANTYVFQSGAGINVAGGITTVDGLYIGQNAPTTPNVGAIYAESGIDTNYSVTAGNNISIGTVLQVLANKNLTIGGVDGTPVNLTAGTVEATGGFTVSNVATASFAQFVASGAGAATINANSLTISDGDFQTLGTKTTNVNLGGGAFSIANGGIENKSTGNMTITAGAINARTITNENHGANLAINASSMNITGIDSTTNSSFVNKGNFAGDISGATNLAHGFDLSTMSENNTFNLKTGTLSLGERIAEFYSNKLNSFTLNVTNGGINIGTNLIRNGIGNSGANMNITAQNITANGIQNLATMNITSGGAITMTGDITNSGTIGISGATLNLANIGNSGAATISGTGTVGVGAINNLSGAESLSVTGSEIAANGMLINNSGTMTLSATSGDVDASGITVNNGTVNISSATLNIGTSGIDIGTGGKLNVAGDITSDGEISVANDLITGTNANAGGLAVSGGVVNITINDDKLSVGGNVTANGAGNGINIDAHTMEIGGNVNANNSGTIILGGTGSGNYSLMVEGDILSTDGGDIYLHSDNALISGTLGENSGLVSTDDVNITAGMVNFSDGLWFDNADHSNGFVIDSETVFTLNTDTGVINGGNVASGKVLNISRIGNQLPLNISGTFTNSGTVNIGNDTRIYGPVALGTITNNGDFNIWSTTTNGDTIINNAAANLAINSNDDISLTNLTNNGSADISGTNVSFGTVVANSGNAESGGIRVTGTSSVSANALNMLGGAGAMNIDAPNISIAGTVDTQGGTLHQGSASTGTLNLTAENFTFNADSFVIDSFMADGGAGIYNVSGTADFGSGIWVDDGAFVKFNRNIIDAPTFNIAGDLVQNASASAQNGTFNTSSDNFTLNTNTVVIDGDIDVNKLTISNLDATNGVSITVGGDISGGLSIMGLDRMTVGGDYTFNHDSKVLAIANSSATHDYWTDVDFSGDTPLINDLTGGETALITVNGALISNTFGQSTSSTPAALADSQFGIVLKQSVTESSALWLANASDIRGNFAKLSVGFCNADGTQCVNYMDALNGFNGTDDNLPIYLMTQGNNLYVVFDNRFATPVEMFKLQPVVAATNGHTDGELDSAGALDNLIADLLTANGYSFDTAILPVVENLFDNTPLSGINGELYARMYEYAQDGNGDSIRAFSRLFQLREANQIADSLAINTRTKFQDLSDKFIDEAIWNRNRRLNKLWIDGGYSILKNDFDDIRGDGDRFNLAFGYDWQASDTLILGWMGHGSYTDSTVTDNIDLAYGNSGSISGRVESKMENLGFGGGLYFIDTLSTKARLYGDVIFDMNMIDVKRNQTWVDEIKGDATSFGVIAEFGLIHDWLNQYIIGNLYARGGYNFGFDMTEKVGDSEYMKLKFDGHAILTPGYSLTAQKRVYPSSWFQFRPYATIGLEYDVLGTPDTMKYKFAMANGWSDYDIEIDPLWANSGAGIEFLGVNGWHIGLGYRYQYNAAIQTHKIDLNMKYRF